MNLLKRITQPSIKHSTIVKRSKLFDVSSVFKYIDEQAIKDPDGGNYHIGIECGMKLPFDSIILKSDPFRNDPSPGTIDTLNHIRKVSDNTLNIIAYWYICEDGTLYEMKYDATFNGLPDDFSNGSVDPEHITIDKMSARTYDSTGKLSGVRNDFTDLDDDGEHQDMPREIAFSILASICLINHPKHFILQETTIQRGKKRNIEKLPKCRQSKYILLEPNKIRKIMGLLPSDGTGVEKEPHDRRGHDRYYRKPSDEFRPDKSRRTLKYDEHGQPYWYKRWIKDLWIGPSESVTKSKHYIVVLNT